MAIAFYFELPDMPSDKAEKVLQMLDVSKGGPKGQIFHAEGPLEKGGSWVFDMWESEADFGAFAEKNLGPVMQKLGIAPPHPKMLKARVALTPQGLRHL